MDLYQAILKRKSIRKYDMTPLDSNTLEEINKYIENIQPYNPDIKVKTYIVNDEKQIKGMFKIKAPHYIAITSEEKEGYLENVGYILEQLVIYLTQKGIGSCWLGDSKPKTSVEENNPLGFVIMIAFGAANEKLYREDISEFKRKGITDISNLNQTNDILEAVHLAPSAMNKQLWYFNFNEDGSIEIYRKEDMKLFERMSKIDIGIAMSHIYIAAQKEGKNIEFSKYGSNNKKGYSYVTTCYFK